MRQFRIETIRHEKVVIDAIDIADAEIIARCLVQSAPKDTCKLHGIIDIAWEQAQPAAEVQVV